MSPATPNGLRYPTPQDLLADTPVYINNLRDDVAAQLASKSFTVRDQQQITCDANGGFAISITDFATLRGLVFNYVAAPNNVWTMMPLITVISSQGMNGQLIYQDTNRNGASVHPFQGVTYVSLFAWGDPR